ncbi:MAG: AAA family ATPase [Anaerolineales bacterium]|nr:AAA family ATPase [Anaerolineales bacterium]
MINISGCLIDEKIHESANSLIYRGRRETDNRPVILKVQKKEYPSPEEMARFRLEYEITRTLNLPGVFRLYGLEHYRNGLVMIMEDLSAESLSHILQTGPLSLSDFLEAAIKIATILGQIHQQHVMHKDINPSNIVAILPNGAWEFKVIDFGLATVLSRETPNVRNPNILEGTLPYMSPEQTGRMNRAVDYRTDFYSLGITFYELLTGQLPFQSRDAMELVHSHIARRPIPPHELQPAVPEIISNIVMKLLAKTAEDRYQSAYGLISDLERCLTQFEREGRIDPFPLGRHDLTDRFQIPQKLYGREEESAFITAAFERVSQGATELLLVSGYSGIGKTALIQELHKPLVAQRGYFIGGKFNQLQRNIPYHALIQAFQELIRQILTESEAQLNGWRDQLQTALGPNGQVIIEVIPEVGLIIGPQPAVPELPPSEAQNRFNLVFQNFVRVFAQLEHPLVVFLDDLQWADSTTLGLIKLLVTDPDTHHLLLIGAYRSNEIDAGHPLNLTLKELRQTEQPISEISLLPLNLLHVTNLISDTLNSSLDRVQPLAELTLAKTNGNPFFVNEFLTSLYEENRLFFVPPTAEAGDQAGWQWDISQLRQMSITDNVVELMAAKIQKLAEATQHVLELAACIGSKFDLETLSIVHEKSAAQTATDLWPAIQEGLIVPLDDHYLLAGFGDQTASETETTLSDPALPKSITYKFLHDRVQQAAYSLIPEANKQAVHRRIGQLMLQNTPAADIGEHVFDIVNQLNLGAALVTEPEAKKQLAELNLRAGQKAHAATAYEPALTYLTHGIDLLDEHRWQTDYDLMLGLHVAAVESAYFSGNFYRMQTLSAVVLHNARSLLDKVSIYEIRILYYTAQNEPLKALAVAREVLDMLGVSLPEQAGQLQVAKSLASTRLSHLRLSIDDLYHLPEMTDPHQLATMRVLMRTVSAAYIAGPELFPFIVFNMVRLSVQYGNSALSAFGYMTYGLILCAGVGFIDYGYNLGEFALRLMDKFQAKDLKAKLIVAFNVPIKHWKAHIRETLAPFQEGYQSGLETGDIEYACHNGMYYANYLFAVGEPLAEVAPQQAQYLAVMKKFKQEFHLTYTQIWHQLALNLLGQASNPIQLTGSAFDETARLPELIATNNQTALFCTYLAKTMLAFLFGDPAQAVANAKLAEPHEQAVLGSINVAEHKYYQSLALLAHYAQAKGADRPRYLSTVRLNQRKMRKWAKHAPMNYQHKHDLVAAELARVTGDMAKAFEYYDKAIAGARANDYTNDLAVAHELAARFYLSQGKTKIAHSYLLDARHAYLRWGATAKVNDLDQTYPDLLTRGPIGASSTIDTTPVLNVTPTGSDGQRASILDVGAVIKAAQAISGEIVLSRLLRRLMEIVIENAGAQHGFLILEQNDQLVIEAESDAESAEVKVLQASPVTAQADRLAVSIVYYVARTKESVMLDDAARAENFAQDSYIKTGRPKSILCMPLTHQGELSGILYLENNLTTKAFTPERIEVLQFLSTQIAISIENAVLYDDLKKAEAEIRRSEEYFRAMIENASDVITMLNRDGKVIYQSPAIEHILGYKPSDIVGHNMLEFVHPDDQQAIIDSLTGLIETERDPAPIEFRARDGQGQWRYVEAIGNNQLDNPSVGGIVVNARDITERKQAERERAQFMTLQRDLALAKDIQQSLLPSSRPDWPLDIICYSTPAREMGGDLYAYHHFAADTADPEKFAMAVGDVSGKGMPAALLMAVTLASFQSTISQHVSPGQLLGRLDQTVEGYTGGTRQNCAMIYVEISVNPTPNQRPAAILKAANAGCISPIIRRQNNSVEWVEARGMPLGAGLGGILGYGEITVSLETGDLVILTSDGVVEAQNGSKEMFGFDRLEAAVAQGPQTNAQAMLTYLIDTINQFVGDIEPHDDLTIVVVQI